MLTVRWRKRLGIPTQRMIINSPIFFFYLRFRWIEMNFMEEEFDATREDGKEECASKRNHIFQASKQRGLARPPLLFTSKRLSHTRWPFFLTFNCIKLGGKKYLIYYNKSIQNIKFFLRKVYNLYNFKFSSK
jgi:hypothetical protein